MYVAVKGGEKAINNAHQLQAKKRRGNPEFAELTVAQISEQLSGSVDRVMTEGGIYDRELAALAVKQANGDLVEAIFLLRAYRTTLPRLSVSQAVNTSEMRIERRISATYKDLPGGQVLGPTYDYTHRLLDFSLIAEGEAPRVDTLDVQAMEVCPQVMSILENLDLMTTEEDNQQTPEDITMHPVNYPCDRSARLQNLVRGDEGFLLALGYSTQRGYGRNHPFAGEIRIGFCDLSLVPEELGFAIDIGEVELTECQMVNGFVGSKTEKAKLTRGYGLTFGSTERKAMSMALVDRSLQAADYDEAIDGPAQDEEFVLSHSDNVEAAGFVSHLKLPHYVDFQAELELLRKMHKEHDEFIQSQGEQNQQESQS
ncbi:MULTISPECIES: carbon-phosphorus lyase complex subunit PhnI [Vibrio]|uniref:carbon-phosphorus lyase complex subunit PhnI n=1 Tax=Vibrio TaxID=662 RepID=UPI0007831634|nr:MULTISPECIES: carbon-phosphorus lyase complex subunit PhnI [Vibrio]MCG9656225.1 carbon-phosphorus lyase complex subunit PhnI [Vibrio mediterranei]MCG9664149.1 carbon-phosphorus lyase complex subunit PhnI [Vibrio mediterranei]PTC06257.1 carbon-phosphorus lyase complex subunit PhnI [Vibrio mediterranei]SBO09028.1 Alpha-D-ribose 1-methylphosphonate 5-triphosphate synthase subunit PhnI [Vibrio mediterranei]